MTLWISVTVILWQRSSLNLNCWQQIGAIWKSRISFPLSLRLMLMRALWLIGSTPHRIVLSIKWQAARMLQGQLLWICSPAVLCFPSEALYAEPTSVFIIASFAWVFNIEKASVASKKRNTKESYCLDIIEELNCITVSTILNSQRGLFFVSKCAVCNCLEVERKPLSIIVLAPFLLSQKQLIAIITIGIFNEDSLLWSCHLLPSDLQTFPLFF